MNPNILVSTPASSHMARSSDNSDLAAVTVASRIPEFWADQPRLWFVQADAVLAPQKLGDEAKYNLIVTKLGREVIQQVSDILLAPPERNKYDAIKKRLLKVYEESENRQLQKLLSETELGDQKPSQLLRKMKELARDKIPNDTLQMLWLRHLPASVRAVLTVTECKDIGNLAVIADKIMETTRPVDVAAVEHQDAKGTDKEMLNEIRRGSIQKLLSLCHLKTLKLSIMCITTLRRADLRCLLEPVLCHEIRDE